MADDDDEMEEGTRESASPIEDDADDDDGLPSQGMTRRLMPSCEGPGGPLGRLRERKGEANAWKRRYLKPT